MAIATFYVLIGKFGSCKQNELSYYKIKNMGDDLNFFNMEKYNKVLNSNYIKQYGKIIKVIGLTI